MVQNQPTALAKAVEAERKTVVAAAQNLCMRRRKWPKKLWEPCE